MEGNQFTRKARPATWLDFIHAGEDHLMVLASISHISMKLHHLRLQLYYNAVENFLKGFYIYLTNNSPIEVEKAIKINHSIDKLIQMCKSHDGDFLKWLNIIPFSKRTGNKLSRTNFEELLRRPEFYTMLEQGTSLKYGGTTKKGEKYKVTISSTRIDTADEIIREILSRIGKFDSNLKWFIQSKYEVKPAEKSFLIRYFR